MAKRRRDPLAQCVSALRMSNALLAALAYQRTGLRPAGFDHRTLPDPWLRLVPYAKASVLLRLEALRRVTGSEAVADALRDLTRVTEAVAATQEPPERAPVLAVDPVSAANGFMVHPNTTDNDR